MKNEKSRPFKKGKKRPERSDKRSKNGTHDQRQQVLMEPQKS